MLLRILSYAVVGYKPFETASTISSSSVRGAVRQSGPPHLLAFFAFTTTAGCYLIPSKEPRYGSGLHDTHSHSTRYRHPRPPMSGYAVSRVSVSVFTVSQASSSAVYPGNGTDTGSTDGADTTVDRRVDAAETIRTTHSRVCRVAGERPVIPRGVRSVGSDESHADRQSDSRHFSPRSTPSDVADGEDNREDERGNGEQYDEESGGTHRRSGLYHRGIICRGE